MKELIGSVFLMASLMMGAGKALYEVHDYVQKAALTKVAQGLPSLTQMTRVLRNRKL